MPEDDMQQTTDRERGRFAQLLDRALKDYWRVTRERDDLRRGWNIVDPSENLGPCIECGKPVTAARYVWRRTGGDPFDFEFAHIECAQDVV